MTVDFEEILENDEDDCGNFNIPAWLYLPAGGNCFLFFLQDLLWLVKNLTFEDLKIWQFSHMKTIFARIFNLTDNIKLNMTTGGEMKIYIIRILDLRMDPKFSKY